MTIIHKKVCDQCGKEEDLINTSYVLPVKGPWQQIITRDKYPIHHKSTKDFCSAECMFKWYEETQKDEEKTQQETQ